MRLIPALHDIYKDRHPLVVIQKAAQVFVSEYLINAALWCADTAQGGRGNVLYVMPTQVQMDDFSQARFDKAIVESQYLQNRLFPPPPGRPGPARMRLKKFGEAYIYYRGSDSRRQLSSVDADLVLLDEFDQMADGVLEAAQKRLASSRLGWMRIASTPRLPEAGINALFLESDRRYYFLRCPACAHEQKLEWEKNVDLQRALVVCERPSCRAPLDLWAPGEWRAEAPENDRVRGYHLNRLYSPLANLPQMIYESDAITPIALQEFQNSVLGDSFLPPGGRIGIDVLDRSRRDYEMPIGSKWATYMGVDVGTRLHVVIRQLLDFNNKRGASRALFIGDIGSFEELVDLAKSFNVLRAVIDALPEQRKSYEFAKAGHYRPSRVYLAYYDRNEVGHRREWDHGVQLYHMNRTQALDEMFAQFREGLAELPKNARYLGGRVKDGVGEYYREMTALNRTMELNSAENYITKYTDSGKADHYAHAENYCLQAIRIEEPTLYAF